MVNLVLLKGLLFKRVGFNRVWPLLVMRLNIEEFKAYLNGNRYRLLWAGKAGPVDAADAVERATQKRKYEEERHGNGVNEEARHKSVFDIFHDGRRAPWS